MQNKARFFNMNVFNAFWVNMKFDLGIWLLCFKFVKPCCSYRVPHDHFHRIYT